MEVLNEMTDESLLLENESIQQKNERLKAEIARLLQR